jgi:hypothetical protein
VSASRPPPAPPRPALTAWPLTLPHAPPDSHVRSHRRSASDCTCSSAPRHRHLHRLSPGKCAAPPCPLAKPAALTFLPSLRAPAAVRLTSPPSFRIGHRRSACARAPSTPRHLGRPRLAVYAIHASQSTPSTPRCLPPPTLSVSTVLLPLRPSRARSRPSSTAMKSPPSKACPSAATRVCRATARVPRRRVHCA